MVNQPTNQKFNLANIRYISHVIDIILEIIGLLSLAFAVPRKRSIQLPVVKTRLLARETPSQVRLAVETTMG